MNATSLKPYDRICSYFVSHVVLVLCKISHDNHVTTFQIVMEYCGAGLCQISHANHVTFIFQIVMEYCGAGSVSDIMRLRNKTVSKLISI